MLIGEKVTLRALEDGDVELMRTWRNDPEMAQWFFSTFPVSEDEQRAWYQKQKNRKDGKTFMIEAEGRAVGYAVCMHMDERSRSIEVGLHLTSEVRGRGYGKDAFLTLTRFCFMELNMHRVWLSVYAFNTRAIVMYEKLGFVHEGRLREAAFTRGEYQDVVVMSILDQEFFAKHGKQPPVPSEE